MTDELALLRQLPVLEDLDIPRGRAVEIHRRPCAHCPSAHSVPDPEMLDYMAAPREVQIDSVFRCGWRPTKACRGVCDVLGVTEADLRATFGEDGMGA